MRKGKASSRSSGNGSNSNGFLPNSLRIISSCIKNVSSNATTVASSVKSSVASSISSGCDDHKEQVTWAGFDKLELSSSLCKHVLLLGYQIGFQVLDVDDASHFSELVSRRDDGPVTFLQMQPIPLGSKPQEGFRKSHPLLLVVGGDESNCSNQAKSRGPLSDQNNCGESHCGNFVSCPRAVRFYSLRSHSYVHALRFRSTVCMVRCSARIVAVGLATQIYCFDALTLESRFSVLTYPVPQLGGQGKVGVNIGYGPMAVGPRWLAYASNDPLLVKTGRLSPQTLSHSPGVTPSTSPVSSSGLVAHYAMESSKQLAAGIVNLGDRGYKTFSKYCHELLPDGSNASVSVTSGARAGSAISETVAGVVVVKDFISRAVICQFRAHSTPISALCFDSSGTLLVTASVNGNTINIFRIMPSRNNCGSDSQSFDWSSSYVHLYKFHRGIRAAVIQDICFSRYSQWIAVVSSKGTCHVFVLSPFGGDVGLQTINSHSEEPSIAPVLTLPWWSASSCGKNLQSVLPPLPVTLSVVTRIKDSNSGMLNSVSNAAASVSGKVSVPSGALAAVFHNSLPPRQVQAAVKSLEHLLVYTPSGHVVQHEIQPSFGVENDGDSIHHSGVSMQSQDADLSIDIHPVQWWDACRRSNWPEREDFPSEIVVPKQEAFLVSDNLLSATYGPVLSQMNNSGVRSNSVRLDSSTSQERCHWYLSNAEVQYSMGGLPVWQKYKLSFCVTGPPRADYYANGEYEIEQLPVSHLEIRQKDLLPVFDHFHSMRSSLNDRGITARRYSNPFSLEPPLAKDKATEETVICHSKPSSFSSTESSDGGSSRRIDNMLDLDHMNSELSYIPDYQNSNEYYCERTSVFGDPSLLDNKLVTTVADMCSDTKSPPSGVPDEKVLPSEMSCTNKFLGVHGHSADASECYGGSLSKVHKSIGTGMLVKETVCKGLELVGSQKATEVTSNAAVSHSTNSRQENLKQIEPMLAFIEVGRKKLEPAEAQEVTGTASYLALSSITGSRKGDLNEEEVEEEQEEEEEEEDMLGPLCDFSGGGEVLEPAVRQKATDAATLATISSRTYSGDGDKEDHMVGVVFPLFQECSETLVTAEGQRETTSKSIVAVSSITSSTKDDFIREEDDISGGLFALFEQDGMTLDSDESQKNTEAVSNAVNSASIKSQDTLDEEGTDLFGTLFAAS